MRHNDDLTVGSVKAEDAIRAKGGATTLPWMEGRAPLRAGAEDFRRHRSGPTHAPAPPFKPEAYVEEETPMKETKPKRGVPQAILAHLADGSVLRSTIHGALGLTTEQVRYALRSLVAKGAVRYVDGNGSPIRDCRKAGPAVYVERTGTPPPPRRTPGPVPAKLSDVRNWLRTQATEHGTFTHPRKGLKTRIAEATGLAEISVRDALTKLAKAGEIENRSPQGVECAAYKPGTIVHWISQKTASEDPDVRRAVMEVDRSYRDNEQRLFDDLQAQNEGVDLAQEKAAIRRAAEKAGGDGCYYYVHEGELSPVQDYAEVVRSRDDALQRLHEATKDGALGALLDEARVLVTHLREAVEAIDKERLRTDAWRARAKAHVDALRECLQ